MKSLSDGEIIWEPSKEIVDNSVLTEYVTWLEKNKNVRFESYQSLWKWSTAELEAFWSSIWEFCEVQAERKYDQVLTNASMPGAKWFEGSRLNYAENAFYHAKDHNKAIFFRSEHIDKQEINWKELKEKVASVAQSLKNMGVKTGDRVVAYMPNIPETVIAFLAAASIGAVWSSCSPDFGARSVIDRFKQVEPTILFAIDGYQYNGSVYDKASTVAQLQKELTTVKQTVLVPYIHTSNPEVELEKAIPWNSLLNEKCELSFTSVPFDHPLWILYSSGTTGMPKPIVQGHGGILLEHLKATRIHQNMKKDDTVFWFTTTGWMMWNLLMGGLLNGATIVLYDGSPSYPNMDALWKLAEDSRMNFFGTSAPFLTNSMKLNIKPKDRYDLTELKSIFSTGAPLSGDGYKWVYQNVKEDVWLSSSSGGTDVCSGFVGGVPTLPVRMGEIQGAALGVHVQAFDERGNSLVNEVGELVITKPMPSMPLYFLNDKDGIRYHESYFDTYPGIWKHGDWIKIDEKGSCIIYGRSDSTINRSGVRMGTSDLYRAVEALDEVMDSLVIDREVLGRGSSLFLFVALKPGITLNTELTAKIKKQVRDQVSPRFIPDQIYSVEQIPKTLNGKKLEVPIRKLLLGFDPDKSVNEDSMSNPESLAFYKELAKELNEEKIF